MTAAPSSASVSTTGAAASAPGNEPDAQRGWLARLVDVPEFGVVLACVVVFIIVTAIQSRFADIANLQIMGLDLAAFGVLAVGESFTILTAGIDLSPGSMVALTAMTSAWLNTSGHVPAGLCILVALAVGAVVGYLHGWFITRLDVPPFVITLVTLTAAAGGALAITKGQPISGVSKVFSNIELTEWGRVPVPVVLLVVIALLAWFLLERTYIGREIYAVGGNREAARLAGIPVARRTVLAYMVSGTCAGIVGVLQIGRLGVGDPSVGSGWELDAIAAAVIGGVSLFGGEGRIVGIVAGAVLLEFINNALIVLNVSPFYQQIALGLVLGVAIVADRLRARRRGRPRPRRLPQFASARVAAPASGSSQ